MPLPPKESIVEVHSLCTHSDYRGGDLIQGMFEHIARCLLLSDRQWLLTFTTAELWPLYRRIGFRKTGASAAIKALNGIEHHMILLHRDSLICGVGMVPTDWNYFFGELARDLLEKKLFRPGIYQRARIWFYLLFEGYTRLWLKNKLEREFQVFLGKGHKK